MLKKWLLISLMLILPIQVSAGIDMSFQHKATIISAEAKNTSHTCHQDISASNKDGVILDAQSENSSCNACALCMGVGFISTHTTINQIAFSTIFSSAKASFASCDVTSLIKPPIL